MKPSAHVAQSIFDWAQAARPNPDNRDFHVQLGCHFEEVAEMVEMLRVTKPTLGDISNTSVANPLDLRLVKGLLQLLAQGLKQGTLCVEVTDPENFLREMCDQVVTSIATCQTAGMAAVTALELVNKSNWSKFVDGKPLKDVNGKVIKGPDTVKLPLHSCLPKQVAEASYVQ